MKKTLSLLLVCVLLLGTSAMAATFTHPETGEETALVKGKVVQYGNVIYTPVELQDSRAGAAAANMPIADAIDELAASLEVAGASLMNLDAAFDSSLKADIAALSLRDQLVLLLSAMGISDVLDGPVSVELQEVLDAIEADPALVNQAAISRHFPIISTTINGETVPYFAIEFELSGAGYERYGFAQIDDEWVLYSAAESAV